MGSDRLEWSAEYFAAAKLVGWECTCGDSGTYFHWASQFFRSNRPGICRVIASRNGDLAAKGFEGIIRMPQLLGILRAPHCRRAVTRSSWTLHLELPSRVGSHSFPDGWGVVMSFVVEGELRISWRRQPASPFGLPAA